jgi:general secretion pathway protein M
MTRTPANAVASSLGPLQARWAQLAPRERNMLLTAMAVVLFALLWQLLLAPSIKTLRTAPAQALVLDTQLQRMQSLQAQARALQQQSPLGFDEAVRALNLATRQTLGSSAQVSVSGERANVTLQAASADALAQWLAQVRLNARSTPVEARLTRVATPAGVTWSGVLVMGLPAR